MEHALEFVSANCSSNRTCQSLRMENTEQNPNTKPSPTFGFYPVATYSR